MKDRGRETCKNKTLNEDNRCKWNKATLTHILTRQEYCGDVVNFKTTKHFRDKRNLYVDRSQWHITENVHEPIVDRADFENVRRILENAPVKRPNGDGEIHPLSGLLFCKDCGAKMHIRIDYRYGGKRHIAYCSEYRKGKAKNPKCHSPHIMDADFIMQTVADALKKIAGLEEEIRQLENKRRQLIQEQKAQERKDRTKRLCRRMGLFESMLPDTISLTDGQFQIFLEQTIATEHSRHILDGLTAQNAATAAAEAAHTPQESREDRDAGGGSLQG